MAFWQVVREEEEAQVGSSLPDSYFKLSTAKLFQGSSQAFRPDGMHLYTLSLLAGSLLIFTTLFRVLIYQRVN